MEKSNKSSLKALWRFVADDESIEKPSWKYLDHKVCSANGKSVVKWIRNPNFAYEHLSPYISGE